MKHEEGREQKALDSHRFHLRPWQPILLFVIFVVFALLLEPATAQLDFLRAKDRNVVIAFGVQGQGGQVRRGGAYFPQGPVVPQPIQKGSPSGPRYKVDGEKWTVGNTEDGAAKDSEFIDLDEASRMVPTRKRRHRVSGTLAVKMLPPCVPYLTDLALEIDEQVRDLARSDPRETEIRYLSALETARRNEDRRKEKDLLTNLGHLYYLTGRFHKAVEMLESALSIARVLGSVQEEAGLLRDMAAAFTGWGQYERAVDLNELALRLSAGSTDQQTAQMVRNNIGVIEKYRGEYETARQSFGEALKTDPEGGLVKILILRNLGDLCRQWGDFDCARESYTSMLESARSLHHPTREAVAHMRLAEILADQERYEDGIHHIQKAMSVLEAAGAPADLAEKLMGDMYLDLGMTEKAEPYLTKAGYASSLGRLKLLQSQARQAEQHYLKLLSAAEHAGNPDALFTAHTGLGMVAEALKDYGRATKHYTSAVAVLEKIRSGLLPSERRNFFSVRVNGFRRSVPSKRLVEIAVRTGRPEESVYPSEMTRARTFADNLSARGDGVRFGVPRSVLIEESRLTTKAASLRRALHVVPRDTHPERYRDLTAEIREAASTLKSFVSRLYQDYDHYASVRYPRPTTLADALIRPDEYVMLIDQLNDGLALRLLKGKQVIGASFVQWDLKDQVEAVNAFRTPFEKCRLRSFDCDLAGRIYQRLFSSMIQQVPRGSRFIIIPDGNWALIPFEAMVAEGKAVWKKTKSGPYADGVTYMGDLWNISYYQSLTAMTLVRRLKVQSESGRRLLVIADPVFSLHDARARSRRFLAQESDPSEVVLMEATDPPKNFSSVSLKRLRHTGVLAKNLKELYGKGCDSFTGFECTKKAFRDQIAPQLTTYKYLVFATHGFAANSVPGIMEPILWLSIIPRDSGGLLTMSEVAGLKVDADLAALTACQTGLGQMLAGEGVMSMGRAFQCAGAKSVLMSLWGVYEPSSVTLTEEFFRSLRNGKMKLDALKSARDRIRSEGYKHPFYWAAFILVGETD